MNLSEILVILLVALIVIRPEKLPDAAFQLGRFTKIIQKLVGKIKNDMNDIIDAHEKPNERKPK